MDAKAVDLVAARGERPGRKGPGKARGRAFSAALACYCWAHSGLKVVEVFQAVRRGVSAQRPMEGQGQALLDGQGVA